MRRVVFILLAAAYVIMSVGTSCEKVQQPPEEVISEADKTGDDTHQGGGSFFSFHKKRGNGSNDNNGAGGNGGGSGSGNGNNSGGGSGNGNGGSGGGNSGGGNGGGNSGGGSNNGGNGGNGGGNGGSNNGGNGGSNNGGNGGGNSGGGSNGGNSGGGSNNGGNGGGNGNNGNNGNTPAPDPTKGAKVVYTWTVDYCILNISGGGISIMAGFKGCDIEEMARMAERNGATFDISKVAGYKVTRISLFDNNILAVYFANEEVFYGELLTNGSKIKYTFKSGGKDLEGISAEGTLTFPAKKNAVLILNATIKDYSGSVEFNMIEV